MPFFFATGVRKIHSHQGFGGHKAVNGSLIEKDRGKDNRCSFLVSRGWQ